MNKYDWVTHEMFEAALAEVIDDYSSHQLLAIPGVYSVLAEALNNEVLARLEGQRPEDDFEVEEEEHNEHP